MGFGSDGAVPHEGIASAFLAEGRHGSVSRDEAGIVAERPETCANGLQQVRMVAAREIGATDAACKQNITDQGEVTLGVVEDDVSRRMSGAMQDVEGLFTDCDLIPVFQPAIREKCGDCLGAEHSGLSRQLLEPETVVYVRTQNGDPGAIGHFTGSADVVQVAMGKQNLFQINAQFLCDGQQSVG